MKLILTSIFLVLSSILFSQTKFKIDDFSKDYYGLVIIQDTAQVYSKGSIAIYNSKTNKQILKIHVQELAFTLNDNKLLSNIKSIPYGEQSLIMYEDYNFDGIKDLAINDGQNSCYHGPSFKIYLASNNDFSFNKDFTRLAQDYCGMFHVDSENKTLETMRKDGCCWHEYSLFIVENNKPKAIQINIFSQQFPFETIEQQTWDGKKMIYKSISTIDLNQEGIENILSFTVPENGKTVTLFNINDRTLNYVLLKKDGTVEFKYPLETIYQNPDFKYNPNQRSVTFKNKNASYQVYETNNTVGIKVIVDNKTYNLMGNYQTKKGSLQKLARTKLDNVTY